MVFYILVIAVLNLGVGFAMAAYIGRQYRAMISADDPWKFDQAQEIETAEAETSEAPGDTTAETSPDAASPSDDSSDGEALWDELLDTESSDVDASIDGALEDLTDESLDEALGIAETGTQAEEEAKDGGDSPGDEPTEDRTAETDVEQESDVKQEPDVEQEPEKSAAETCVEEFRNDVSQYHEELKQADSGLRSATDPLEAAAIEQVLGSLREATEQYITERNQQHDSFEELHQSDPQFDGIRERLQTVTQQQDEQIASTNEAVDAIDYEAGLEEGHRQMLHETGKLMNVNDQLRDELDEALLRIAQSENRLDDLDAFAHIDPLTETQTRAGLESALADLWQKDSDRSRQFCGVLIDLDQFGRINEEHGRAVGDRTLATVAQAIRSEDLGEGSVLARVAGQQFFVLLPDADTRTATNVAERARQIIDVTRFQYRDQDVAVTVSCSVAMAEPDDTSATLLERLRTTLKEAKRYGRNRTFLCEGQFPTPVVPPNLSLKEKHVPL
ncbi:MAG: diguanylate cyclase [Thermoguttaceae bacterium]